MKIVLFITVLFLGACANYQVYEGEKLPSSETVIVRGMSSTDISAGGYAAKICAVDNVRVSPCKPFVEFLPGEKTLELVATNLGIFSEKKIITKKFEAGDRYRLGISFRSSVEYEPVLSFEGNVNTQ